MAWRWVYYRRSAFESRMSTHSRRTGTPPSANTGWLRRRTPMPKAPVALALLAWVAVLPAPLAAGPPAAPSGAMVLDEVAEGLRRYRMESDPVKRHAWLR